MAYEDLTVPELKDLLRERGLPLSGKKADLIARLSDADEPQEEEEPRDADEPQEEEDPQDDSEEQFEEDDYEEEEGDFEEWDDLHTARQKPVLDDSTKEALKKRSEQRKKQPKFRRQEWFRYRRLSKTGYRKPRDKSVKDVGKF